jgi:hypothetical protein
MYSLNGLLQLDDYLSYRSINIFDKAEKADDDYEANND